MAFASKIKHFGIRKGQHCPSAWDEFKLDPERPLAIFNPTYCFKTIQETILV